MFTQEQIQELSIKAQNILECLPYSYYLRTKTIKVSFSDTSSTSYFNAEDFEIVISLSNIIDALSGAKNDNPNAEELEKTIRCFLYHEISHAILTPTDLMTQAAQWNGIITPNLANIIEDERIETLLKDYYLKVDFKKNLKNVCQLDKNIKSFEHFVFNAVRFRWSPIKKQEVNALIDNFIVKCKNFNASHGAYGLVWYADALLKELSTIYQQYQQQLQQQQQNNNQSSSNEEDNEDNSQDSGNNNQSSSNEENEDREDSEDSEDLKGGKSSNEENQNNEEEDKKGGSTSSACGNGKGNEEEDNDGCLESAIDSLLSKEEIENAFENALETLKKWSGNYGLEDVKLNNSLVAKFVEIIIKNIGVGVKETPSQYGTCGRFNAKKFMKDHQETFKWFEKRAYDNSGINSKRGNEKVLNIILDNSGSFSNNDEEVNKILRALSEVEKKYKAFHFNLITFGSRFIEKSGNNRISTSTMGNTTIKGLSQIFGKYNKTKQEVNILLTDGSCDCLWELASTMNNKQGIIISASDNKKTIKNLCPNAKKLIFEDRNYTQVLADNVIKALDLLF